MGGADTVQDFEVRMVESAFADADADKDGLIDSDELQPMFDALEKRTSDAGHVAVIESQDKNGDGKLGFEEVIAGASEDNGGTSLDPAMLKAVSRAFEKADVDKDGLIGVEEMQPMIGEIERGPLPEDGNVAEESAAADIFNELDKDKDGKVSLKEMEEGMIADSEDSDAEMHKAIVVDAFKKADADGNGFADMSEVETMMDEVKKSIIGETEL